MESLHADDGGLEPTMAISILWPIVNNERQPSWTSSAPRSLHLQEVCVLRTERGPMCWLIPSAVIILATVLIGIVIVNQGGSDADAQGQSSSSQGESAEEDTDLTFVEHRDADEHNAIGDVDA